MLEIICALSRIEGGIMRLQETCEQLASAYSSSIADQTPRRMFRVGISSPCCLCVQFAHLQ
jgi:hypothetical protein